MLGPLLFQFASEGEVATAFSRILRIKHFRLLLMARPEGRDEHSWAQRFIHVQAAMYMHDYPGP